MYHLNEDGSNSRADNQYGSRRGLTKLDAINPVGNTAKKAITETRWKEGIKVTLE